MRQLKILAVITGVLACASAQAGDVYKVVDERGNATYTDKPVPGAVRVSTADQRPPEVAARNYASQQAATNTQLNASNQRIATQQSDARVAAAVANDLKNTQAERCKKARDGYNDSIRARRIYRTNESGQREFLSDAEIAAARVQALKNVEAICGPNG
jgi:hypothetical protein